jgi:hypothetical protein
MEMLSRRVFVVAALLLLAGCASTTIRDQWSDPGYRGGPFKKLLVLGVSSNIAERHTFEDVMAARIAATGVEAVQAYRYLPDSAQVPEAELEQAVKAAGADGLVMSRIRAIDRRTSVSTVMVPGPPFGPFGYHYYGWYSGWYPTTDVRQYDIAIVETSVFAADTKRVVWAGMTETFQPTSVARDAPDFANVIVKAMQERGLLPAGK